MTAKEQLNKDFDRLNLEKFEGKLPKYEVRLRSMRSFGNCNWIEKVITINPNHSDESIANILLHEMIHAELHRRGFRNAGHPIRFWRMFAEKGGVITEINKELFAKARTVVAERNKIK